MRELARWIDALQERVGRGVSWLMLALVLLVFTDVIFRYLFSRSFVFVQELEWHLFGLVYLLAAGWSYLRGGDIGVHNPFERLAGLADGGYPLVSPREQRRQERGLRPEPRRPSPRRPRPA